MKPMQWLPGHWLQHRCTRFACCPRGPAPLIQGLPSPFRTASMHACLEGFVDQPDLVGTEGVAALRTDAVAEPSAQVGQRPRDGPALQPGLCTEGC